MPKSEVIALAIFAAMLAALFTFTACRDEAGLKRAAIAAPMGSTQV